MSIRAGYGLRGASLRTLRLIAPTVGYANFYHFFLNMTMFNYMGSNVEILSGHPRMLAAYVMSGLTGSLCSMACKSPAFAGASGNPPPPSWSCMRKLVRVGPHLGLQGLSAYAAS